MAPHFLIIDARFYPDIADELVEGATQELAKRGATWDRISVPGVLEIPVALSMALLSSADDGERAYAGYVLLGCVIRGETAHFDIVAGQSARAIMDLAVEDGLAVGNGILTVEDDKQAWARARMGERNKGGAAAKAAYEMAELRRKLGVSDA